MCACDRHWDKNAPCTCSCADHAGVRAEMATVSACVTTADFLLTDRERQAARRAGELWGDLCAIVGDGPTRDADLHELVVHIHAIQHAIMSQAAGRAYPAEFRLLGSTLRVDEGSS